MVDCKMNKVKLFINLDGRCILEVKDRIYKVVLRQDIDELFSQLKKYADIDYTKQPANVSGWHILSFNADADKVIEAIHRCF